VLAKLNLTWLREKREKSYVCFVDDLKRCQALGLELYNFQCVMHASTSDVVSYKESSPGSTVGQATLEESLGLIAECINRAHKETQGVTAVVENMVLYFLSSHSSYLLIDIIVMKAGAGNIIGSDFSHLAGIIDRVEDKTRIGVCIDTCKFLLCFLVIFYQWIV
jgi:AP endonuclease-1